MAKLLTEADELLELWPDLDPAERLDGFRSLPRDQADDFFLALGARNQLDIIRLLPPGERRIWLRLLAPDDTADLMQIASKEEQPELLGQLDDVARREVNALLAYQDDVAGGLMSPRFIRLRPGMTTDEAISYLRRQAGQVETIYYAYVLDEYQRLLGVVSFRALFSADSSKTVRDVMRTKYVVATEDLDQEAVAKLVSQNHLLAIPVVDAEGRMKGIVTVDDIVDVVVEEAGEDIQKIGGLEALDGPYLEIRFWSMLKKRAGWLAVLFLGEMLTATAMGHFEEEIARAVVLALFVPLIISSGGNSGSQATTLVIRAMAVQEVRLRDWWRVIRREIGAGLALGTTLALIGLVRILVWQAIWHSYGEHSVAVAFTVAVSLVGVVLFGTIAGSMLPFLLRRAGLDPASASAPFVATLVDVTGLVIYFSVASVILRGRLL
ncbi:magnesium transporter [Bryobacter aggregatus]|uniref:magnesium transporter n=1 Tax=Bryobacter aggregatus TaxID=360054 RepID=UPI0004E20875|nr:magnesium transporter [Bryobacter aggregatus]